MAVNIVRAAVWPLIVLIGILVLWRSGALGELGRRTTKISVFQVGLELATVTQRDLPGLEELRDPVAPSEVQSGEKSLMQQLLEPNDIDYVVIDLRDGRRWLGSRLYLFSELLFRQRNLKCIIFVERRDRISRRFIGLADPMDVKWAMASRFPWLELALNEAYTQAFKQFPSISFSRSGGRLEPFVAGNVASYFLGHPNISWTDGQPLQFPWTNIYQVPTQVAAPWARQAPLPCSPQHEWVIVRGEPAKYEHTKWLTGRYLSDAMGTEALREDDWLAFEPGASEERQVLDVLSRSGDFVAAVNSDRSFRRLIERRLVVEEVARREVKRARTSGGWN